MNKHSFIPSTYEEARLVLNFRLDKFELDRFADDIKEAINIAKTALDEIQTYKELNDKIQTETGISVKELCENWNSIHAEYAEYKQLGTPAEIKAKLNGTNEQPRPTA